MWDIVAELSKDDIEITKRLFKLGVGILRF